METKKTKINLIKSRVDKNTGAMQRFLIGSIEVEADIPPGVKITGNLHIGIDFEGEVEVEVAASTQKMQENKTDPSDNMIPDVFEVSIEDIERMEEEAPITDDFLCDFGDFLIREILSEIAEDRAKKKRLEE